ncbi:MAG TPA: FtsQ-type POTRA domain-containing protein [Acidimicrobiia bacterium]|nr:FtsQ-type POTRA domain-containing protein [Acidimicrobiia bacterium]
MVDIDPRLAARREQVAEAHARSSFFRVMWILALGTLVAGAVWLARSPFLALKRIEVNGMQTFEIEELLVSAGLVAGRPMVTIRTGEVEAALLTDPRVEDATVHLAWPQTAHVFVEPRRPVAWAPHREGWAKVAGDGVVISTAEAADNSLPILNIEGVGVQPSASALGALAFLMELAPQPGAEVEVRMVEDELWAMVAGTDVRLGRPIEMEAKARALVALFLQGIPPGTSVNLLAPTRPALIPLQTEESQVLPEP